MRARKLIDGAAYGPDALPAIGEAFDTAWGRHRRLVNVMVPQRGAGDCLSGLVGLLGVAGFGPLAPGAPAPPEVAGGPLSRTRGRGGDVPVAGPVAGVSVAPGAREVGGLVLV
jgi:hypothetical protein